jgi:hypothetical protein
LWKKHTKKKYSVFSKEHLSDTSRQVLGSVSTPLDNLLQPVRQALHHVAQNLAGYCAIRLLFFKHASTEKFWLIFRPILPGGPLYQAPTTQRCSLKVKKKSGHAQGHQPQIFSPWLVTVRYGCSCAKWKVFVLRSWFFIPSTTGTNFLSILYIKLQRFLNLRCWSMGGET